MIAGKRIYIGEFQMLLTLLNLLEPLLIFILVGPPIYIVPDQVMFLVLPLPNSFHHLEISLY